MAYSELIKSFEKIRGYMRDFYVYGFKSREQYDRKSARSYDNERRRIESWLGDYMSFRQATGGKTVFLSVDNRGVPHNPLYKAFKTKSFTANDITLHFTIMDLLADGDTLTVKEIVDQIADKYLAHFEHCDVPDESTVRKKLKEYEKLGLLEATKIGRESAFRRAQDGIDLETWHDAIDYFSEADPMGVVGSYLLDKYEDNQVRFSYKHHYLLHALDSEILHDLLAVIHEHRAAEITSFVVRRQEERTNTVLPVKIYVSTQTGRQYLLAYHYRLRRPMFFRIDNIRSVKAGAVEKRMDKYGDFHDKLRENLWGVSLGAGHSLDHIEMTLQIGKGEEFIIDRLNREKRCGRIYVDENGRAVFAADVYDATEMMPWIRSFIGRIADLKCTNEAVTRVFHEDMERMREMYGGAEHAVQ